MLLTVIGGPGKEDGPSKKPGFMKSSKPRKIMGIGGDYSSEDPEPEDQGMDNEEKMLEAARPMARAMGIPSKTVVDAITAICNLMNSKPSGEDEPAESDEGEE